MKAHADDSRHASPRPTTPRAGIGVLTGRTRAARRLAAAAAARAPRLQRRGAAVARDDDPPPAVLAQLVELLEADEDRSVVPVRVFWMPGGLPTRSKVVACCRAATPTVRRSFCSAASFVRTPHVPASWPVSRRRYRSCASSGTTPPSPKTQGNSHDSSFAAPAWPSNAWSCACSAPSTNRHG